MRGLPMESRHPLSALGLSEAWCRAGYRQLGGSVGASLIPF